MAVVGEAVELDYQALLRPEGVDLKAEESSVDGGEGEPVRAAQGYGQILKRGAGGSAALFEQEVLDEGEPPTSHAELAGSLEGIATEKAKAIRLLVGTSKSSLGERLGNV